MLAQAESRHNATTASTEDGERRIFMKVDISCGSGEDQGSPRGRQHEAICRRRGPLGVGLHLHSAHSLIMVGSILQVFVPSSEWNWIR